MIPSVCPSEQSVTVTDVSKGRISHFVFVFRIKALFCGTPHDRVVLAAKDALIRVLTLHTNFTLKSKTSESFGNTVCIIFQTELGLIYVWSDIVKYFSCAVVQTGLKPHLFLLYFSICNKTTGLARFYAQWEKCTYSKQDHSKTVYLALLWHCSTGTFFKYSDSIMTLQQCLWTF